MKVLFIRPMTRQHVCYQRQKKIIVQAEIVAIKASSVHSEEELKNTEEQLQMMKSLAGNCTNIVRVHDYFVERIMSFSGEDIKIYCIMEYCETSLETAIRKQEQLPISTEEKHNWIIQLASAIAFLHSNNIVHRDLKVQILMIRLILLF